MFFLTTRFKSKNWLLGLLTIIFLAACTLQEESRSQSIPLAGTSWIFAGFGTAGALSSPIPGSEITAVFSPTQLTGSSGCNQYGSPYSINGSAIQLTEIATTKMLCDVERNQREIQFLAALTDTASYTTSSNSLTLLDANNNALLTFTQALPPNPLSGVIWELVALETANGPLPTQGTLITAQFIDENVAGLGGCNPYAANYFLAADAYLLLLNNIGHGLESCTNPVQLLETSFFSLMETAESFTTNNNTLTIYSTRGTLSFTQAPFSNYQPPFVMLPNGIHCSRTTTDDLMTVNDKQRRYYCFQSGSEMTILIGDFQPDANGWLTEKATIIGAEENFTVPQTEMIHVTLP